MIMNHFGASLYSYLSQPGKAFRLYGVFACWLMLTAGAAWLHQGTVAAPHLFVGAGAQPTSGKITTLSAASFEKEGIAPESIVAAFGKELATGQKSAPSVPLPTELLGTTVKVKDKAGVERDAQLFFVSSEQVNFLVPAGMAAGQATVTIRSGDGKSVSTGEMQVKEVAPAIFTANGSGNGKAAALVLRIKANGDRKYEPIAQPIDLNDPSDRVFLLLYGTGLRRHGLMVKVLLGGNDLAASHAPAPGYVGLDQINVELPREVEPRRTLIGRGVVKLAVTAIGFPTSNEAEIEIAPPPDTANPPKVTGFSPSTVLARQTLTIRGSNFDPAQEKNTVIIAGREARDIEMNSTTQISVKAPFSAESGKVAVRTLQGQGVSADELKLSTSLSGYVVTTSDQPLPGMRVEAPGYSHTETDRKSGAFVLSDVPPRNALEVWITTLPPLPYQRLTLKEKVVANRDNHIGRRPFELIHLTGNNALAFGSPLTPAAATLRSSFKSHFTPALASAPLARRIEDSGVVFEIEDAATAEFPAGVTNRVIYLNLVERSRTPVELPPGVFSSTIAQLAPFNVRLTLGGKLTFPNKDGLPVNSQPRLYRLDQTPDSPTLGSFVDAGAATVSADGQRVETSPNAITETSIFLVAVPQPVTTVIGRVLESDGVTPVRGAIAIANGQQATTDGNGGFTLRNVSVPVNKSTLTVEASFQRPSGRVDRTLSQEIRVVFNGVTNVGDLVLPAPLRNRPPVIVAPASLEVTEGLVLNAGIPAFDQDDNQTAQVSLAGPGFATLTASGNNFYTLRLEPRDRDARVYTLTITATDNEGAKTEQSIRLTVHANRAPSLIVPGSRATNAGQKLSFAISATDLDNTPPGLATPQTFMFSSSNLPPGATLTPQADGVSARFDWTPSAGQIGNLAVNFQVTDNGINSLSEAKSVAITVIGQWAPTVGPEGGLVRAFLSAGANLFAGAPGGVYRSSDQGQTWTAANAGIENTDITALAAIGSDLFVGSLDGNRGVYRSTDNGQSWQPANGAAPNNIPSGYRIAALAVSGTILFAGTVEKGLYKSSDKGQNWTAIPIDGLTDPAISSLSFIGSSLFAGTRVEATGAGQVLRSPDLGGTWELANSGLPNDFVTTFVSNGGFLFAGLRGNGVYRSRDNGNSWESTNTNIFSVVFALAVSGSKLFAGTGGSGVYLSTDNGANWTLVNNGLKGKNVYSLAVSGANLLAGLESTGVFRSSNDGANWVSSNKGLIATQIRALGVNGATVLAGTVKSGIFLSRDRGQTWTLPTVDIPTDLTCKAFAVKGTDIFAGTDGGVFRSMGDGQSWSASNGTGSTMLGNLDVSALTANGSLLFAGTGGGVFRSADNGGTWMAKGLANFSVISFAVKGSTLFAGTASGGVFRSTDNGDNWKQVLPSSFFVHAIATNGDSVFADTGGYVFRSKDNGDGWERVGPDFTNVQSLVASEGKLFVGTFSGVFLSTDNGESWNPINFGLTIPGRTFRPVAAFAVSGNNIFAGTFHFGVFVAQQ
jgi:uncharacterized protein (TIGR03437 family)